MFFHTLLLHPQHKMQLSLPWIAATLGVKKLKKDDIIKCNIIKVCDHILLFVTSESLNPNKRFSLRLSAILISGVSQILRQQVIFLREDIDRSLLAREKLADRLLHEFDEDVETPPTPKPAIKRKKVKKPIVETPESLVGRVAPAREKKKAESEFTLEPLRLPDVIQEEAIIQARVAEITLREETARPQEPQLRDDFGLGDIPVPPLPSDSGIQETVVAEVHKPLKSPKKKKRLEKPLEEIQPQPPDQMEEIEKRVEPEMAQIQPQEMQPTEVVPPPPAEKVPEEDITVVPAQPEKVPEEEITIVPAQPEKEPDKDKEKDAEKEKELDLEKEKSPAELARLEVVEPAVEPKVPIRRGKNICALLLLKTKKKKVVFINQKLQIYQDDPQFIPVTNKVPDFKPLTKFWPQWETMHLEVERDRPVRDTESARVSAVTEGSLALGVDKTAETPEIRTTTSFPSVQQIETPSEVTPGPRYKSTPRKRPHSSDQTVEEVMPPAANGDTRPPEVLPKKRRKVVSIEEVQAAELAKDVPEEQLVPQELPEFQPVGVPEVSEIPLETERRPPVEEIAEAPVEKEKSPERSVHREKEDEESPPRPGYPKDAFGVKWSRRVLKVVCQHEKIGPVGICKAINKRPTRLHMSIVFAALLHLAKDQYVLLHSAEDSLELEVIEKGPKTYDF